MSGKCCPKKDTLVLSTLCCSGWKIEGLDVNKGLNVRHFVCHVEHLSVVSKFFCNTVFSYNLGRSATALEKH